MSIASSHDSDLTILQNDIAALKRDVTSLIEHLKIGVTNGAQSAAAHIDDRSRRIYRDATTEGERAMKAMTQQIERQPLLSLLIVLGVGYVGGRLLSR